MEALSLLTKSTEFWVSKPDHKFPDGVLATVDTCVFYISLACSVFILFHLGYNSEVTVNIYFDRVISIVFYSFAAISLVRTTVRLLTRSKSLGYRMAEVILTIYFLFVLFKRTFLTLSSASFFRQAEWLYVGIFGVFLIEFSKQSLFFDRFFFNPTLLFVLSFLFLILLGTILLLLPNVTIGPPMSMTDALFMATSAVCMHHRAFGC